MIFFFFNIFSPPNSFVLEPYRLVAQNVLIWDRHLPSKFLSLVRTQRWGSIFAYIYFKYSTEQIIWGELQTWKVTLLLQRTRWCLGPYAQGLFWFSWSIRPGWRKQFVSHLDLWLRKAAFWILVKSGLFFLAFLLKVLCFSSTEVLTCFSHGVSFISCVAVNCAA